MKAFVGEAPGRALQDVVDALNAGPCKGFSAAAHENLVRLIQAWQQAQFAPPNAFEREHGAPLPTLVKMKLPPGCPDLREMEKNLRVVIAPAGLGSSSMIVYSPTPKRPWTAWDLACRQFIRLMTDPECERFGGPCPRCKKYFIRATVRQSTYCSRRCASQATATEATAKARLKEHAAKLARAEQAKLEWEKVHRKGRTKRGWKEWVAASDPSLSVKFLTRAVNKGELREPSTNGDKK